ncbi:MAG: YeeE/YedE thiosulfate transporter family protein [Candidatus Auribacterota bacterium]|jgi:uncharacterized membrane protein YedE/YeeE|nr:YeeE/YedE thiosulfate transporter family protein [Candidatus Auribacterota bacterium]
MPVSLLIAGFLFGIGFGYFVQRAGLCFAHGLGEIFTGRGQRIIRMFLVIFIISSIGFMVSGYVNPELGLKAIGELRGYGFWNLMSGAIFGAGILLNGGCILGTLRQIGEGNMLFSVILLSFIPGMALVVYVLDPLLKKGYNVHNILLVDLIPVAAPVITGVLAVASIIWLIILVGQQNGRNKRNN